MQLPELLRQVQPAGGGVGDGVMSCKEARRLRTELGCLSLSKHAYPSLILSPLTREKTHSLFSKFRTGSVIPF